MELIDFVKLIKRKTGTIWTVIMVFLAIVFVLNITQPLKYGSELRLLIIQNNLNNTDPYLVSKSSEHLGNVLSQVIQSHSFFKKVATSGYNIDRDYFGQSLKEQTKNWLNAVESRNLDDTGILVINVYHTEREQATQIASAIANALKTSHHEYHGSGDNVEIVIIDDPLTSTIPVKPNILTNLMASFAFGLIFAIVYIYLFPEEKYDLRLLPKRKKKFKAVNFNLNEAEAKRAFEEIVKRNMANFEISSSESPVKKERKETGKFIKDDKDMEKDYEKIVKGGNIDNIL